ncbi:phosphatidylglycerophosphatase A [bacterium]
MKKEIIKILNSVFYIGHIPYAPGTCASVAAYILYWFFPYKGYVLFFMLVLLSVLGVWLTGLGEDVYENHDDKRIVLDEFIGAGFALLFMPQNWVFYILSFSLFRLFDILKPIGIKKTQNLKKGLGIIADDVAAGISANIATWVVFSLMLILARYVFEA